jgi:hypothetical protein
MNPLSLVRTKLRLAGAVVLAMLTWIGAGTMRIEAASSDTAGTRLLTANLRKSVTERIRCRC